MSEKVYYLRNQDVISNAIDFIANLKPDEERPFEVRIRRAVQRRSLEQNALLHTWFRHIKNHLMETHGVYSTEEGIKQAMKERFTQPKIEEVLGKLVYIYPETHRMSVKEMSEFMHKIDMYCAEELDLLLPVGEV